MNKNFIVVGTPRSGTTFVCDVLSKFDDIWIPKFPNYEPFNPNVLIKLSQSINDHAFDHDSIIKNFISFKSDKNAEYFGFKTFLSFHSNIRDLVKDNDLDVILILRKDFWKVVGSMLIAIDNNDYIGTSKKYKPYKFEITKREVRRVITFFNHLCRTYWELENSFFNESTVIDKIYFEDLIENPNRPALEKYFERTIEFNHGYNDDDSIYSYIENFDEMRDFILSEVKKYKIHYSALPDYIKKQFEI